MGAVLFLVAAEILASVGVGLWNTLLAMRANHWFAHGDDYLFWQTWADDLGQMRLILAGLAALVVLALARSPLLGGRPRAFFAWGVRVGSGKIVLSLLVGLLLACHLGAWSKRPDPAGKPSVLFVMLDTIRLDYTGWGKAALGRGPELPESPTPHLDALTARGAWFTQAIANASWTKPSVGTMLTGLMPSRHLAVGRPGRGYYPSLTPQQRTLAEAFAAAGYDTAAISTNPNVSVRYGFGQGFQWMHDEDIPAEKVVALAEEWLNGRRRPFFLYTHFNDAHYPFEPPEGYRGRYDHTASTAQLNGRTESKFRKRLVDFSDEDFQHLRMAYAEEIRYLDDQVGPFVERALDRHPNLMVVIVADHGEELNDHQDLGHGHTLYDELIRVPLQLVWNERLAERRPGLAAQRVDAQVAIAALAPTLLELAGLEWPSSALEPDSASLMARLIGAAPWEDEPVFSETDSDGSYRSGKTGPLRSWRTPEAKAVRTLLHPELPERPVLYWYLDLTSDPPEAENLARERRPLLERLLAAMEASGWLVDKEPPPLSGELDLRDYSAEDREKLVELGYAGEEEGEEAILDIPPVPGALLGESLE